MQKYLELLKKRYIVPMKEDGAVYIGIELEFPIVNLSGEATDEQVCKQLLFYLIQNTDLEVVKKDEEGYAIELYHPVYDDHILFEVSYTTIEFAFGKAKTIEEVEKRFEHYMIVIQEFLRQHGHEIQGQGIHPHWDKNSNTPVQSPRYKMLMDYLALVEHVDEQRLHRYADYGAYICGSQVQLDVFKENYLRVINAFNKIEMVKAYLFANSTFSGENWETAIARDIFWEDSMHGFYHENVGVYPRDFLSEEDFLEYMSHSALFTAVRDEKTVYFHPIQVKDYLCKKEIQAIDLTGQTCVITPEKEDFSCHRAYHYQSLTTRGTVEFRSVCTQPLSRTFASAAFHVGLLTNLEELEQLLQQSFFFERYGRDYKVLRKQFSKPVLSDSEQKDIQKFSNQVLQVARKGLQLRELQEERYLQVLMD